MNNETVPGIKSYNDKLLYSDATLFIKMLLKPHSKFLIHTMVSNNQLWFKK